MNKAELAAVIADKANVNKKQAEDMIQAFVDTIITELSAARDVTIAGFGTFSSFVRKAREGVNPQNISEKIHIGPTKVAKFKAGSTLKGAMKASQEEAATTPAMGTEKPEGNNDMMTA